MFRFWYCGRSNAVIPDDEEEHSVYYANVLENEQSFIEDSDLDQKKAEKYGITLKRYYTIMRSKGMTLELMEILHENNWDFNDKTKDIVLMACLNNSDLNP